MILPLVQAVFQAKGYRIKIFGRHSVYSKKSFHFLLSDLDFTMVASKEEQASASRLGRKLTKGIPFLGEFEIYDPNCFERKEFLEEKLSEVFERLRNTRKLAWLDNESSLTLSEYHRFKNERSMRITAERLGIPFQGSANLLAEAYEKFASLFFEIETKDIEDLLEDFEVYQHHYLGRTLSVSPHPNCIQVSRRCCALLLLLLPIQFTGHENLDRKIRESRMSPKVAQIVRDLAELEALTFGGYLASKEFATESELAWQSEVHAVLSSMS
jgi:hypothetical protein